MALPIDDSMGAVNNLNEPVVHQFAHELVAVGIDPADEQDCAFREGPVSGVFAGPGHEAHVVVTPSRRELERSLVAPPPVAEPRPPHYAAPPRPRPERAWVASQASRVGRWMRIDPP